jgi:MFS family permease
MFSGSVAGGVVAQATNLGVPYVIRTVFLMISLLLAFMLMKDLGFTPSGGRQPISEVKNILRGSIEHGLANRPVRWVMLAAPFTSGVTIYAFYAMQPYLLELYGNERAYAIAGLAAAIFAGAQIAGGLLVPYVGRIFKRRTSVLLAGTLLSALMLATIGLIQELWLAIGVLVVWALMFAALTPVRQAYLNGLIASKERATVLSFDSLLGSSGAVAIQPLLGKAADAWSYPTSYALSAAIQALAIPFAWLARRERAASDTMREDDETGANT